MRLEALQNVSAKMVETLSRGEIFSRFAVDLERRHQEGKSICPTWAEGLGYSPGIQPLIDMLREVMCNKDFMEEDLEPLTMAVLERMACVRSQFEQCPPLALKKDP